MPMPSLIASAGELIVAGTPSTSMVPSSGFWTPYRIFISVDLPAPFSPTMACTVPARTSMSMSWLAITPGKRFPMPRRRTAMVSVSAGVAGLVSVVVMAHAPKVKAAGRATGSEGTLPRPRPSPWPCDGPVLARPDQRVLGTLTSPEMIFSL